MTENGIRCPANTRWPGDITGCGSANVVQDPIDELWDCLDCGIWFSPENGMGLRFRTKAKEEGGRMDNPASQKTERTYEGYVKFADSSVICLQCFDGRHAECVGENSPVLDGCYYCECSDPAHPAAPDEGGE